MSSTDPKSDNSDSSAPKRCLYCDGVDPNCGFCDQGVPLDTQADWDASWGRILGGGRNG